MNPATFGAGGQAMYWTSLNATDLQYHLKKLQFYPITATGNINVLAKVYPRPMPASFQNFDWQDIFYLDTDMLVYATAFMTLSGDDLNAGAADVIRNLMEMKYKDVMAALAKPSDPCSGDSSIPYYWQCV